MKVNLYHGFVKAYKKRIAPNIKLVSKTEERISLFKSNPKNPLLKDHGLTGAKKNLRVFSITGDIRIVYLPVSEEEVTFINIGSHNQVY
ncbi:type II toxin-antitoxin system mRNA interferase toxin, RelE/StbE family [Candidatus Daviesbacteria bacterium]|nr:type II toxin-antitoxin system mRNA interferase toxin, RelE/StbE family [Candidatus Daviesbacteria bacterium]